jgi:DNA-binding SARP family transcriptional activator
MVFRLPAYDQDLEFQILGPFAVRVNGRTVPLRSPKHRILLAMLLLRPGRSVPVEELADAIWGDDQPGNPRRTVQVHIARMRKVLACEAVEEEELVVTDVDGYHVNVRPEQVDLGRFDEWLRRAEEAAGREDLDREIEALDRALAQWRGEPLAGLPCELFQRDVAPRLRERRLEAVERRFDLELRRGRHTELVGDLLALTAEHPFRERLWALLMRALHAGGRRAGALDAYHTVRQNLSAELGIDPSDELQDLYTTILVGRAQPALLPPVPRQLPRDVPAFVRGTGELLCLDALLPGCATTTVVGLVSGMAGLGKTALATHWAHRVADRFPDGQLWASLRGHCPDGAVSPGHVLGRFLRALGVPDADLPAELDDQVGLFRSLMDGRRMLIVLDNAGTAHQVRPLLPGAPGSLVLVTSRYPLPELVAVDGARPLELGLLTPGEARRLLAARLGAARIAAEPDAVNKIIGRCGGLPAALTLVAARAATNPRLGLGSIAAELPNHRLGAHPPGSRANGRWPRAVRSIGALAVRPAAVLAAGAYAG